MYDVNWKNEMGDYQFRAIASRLAATRPLEEQKARDAYYLDRMYGSIDKKERDGVVQRVRTYLRDGNLNEEVLSNLAEEYMRTGTPRGWRAALNKAIAQTSQPASNSVRNYLSPDSPLHVMLDDL